MIKRLKYIFIPVLAVLFMSHNVDALSNTYYLNNDIYAYGIPQGSGGQGGTTGGVTSGQTYNLQNNIYVFSANSLWYSMKFYFNAEHTQVDLSKYTDYTFTFTYCSDVNYFMPSSNDLFRMTNYYEFEADAKRELTDFRNSTSANLNIQDIERCRNVIMYGKVGVSSNNGFQLGTTSNGSFTRVFGIMPYDVQIPFKSLVILSPTVVFYDNPNEADEAIQKEKQNVQDAADNSSTAGGSSSSDATGATSSLLSVIGAGVGAITTATPTNCKINGNMGNLNIGNIDLCANPVPSFIVVIGSIIAVLVVLPLVIVLFNRFISIIRSFQG